MRDTKESLSYTTVILHWLVGILIIFMLGFGFIIKTFGFNSFIALHKSIGVIVLCLVFCRVAWRLLNGWPKSLSNYSSTEVKLAKFVHWILIICTVAIPLSGFITSTVSGHGVSFFGVNLVAPNFDPANPDQHVAYSSSLTSLGSMIHTWASYIITAAIILHVMAAIKHHFYDRDRTLLRMLKR